MVVILIILVTRGLLGLENNNYGPFNAFFHANIDTCDGEIYKDYNYDNQIFQGIPRFNSAADY